MKNKSIKHKWQRSLILALIFFAGSFHLNAQIGYLAALAAYCAECPCLKGATDCGVYQAEPCNTQYKPCPTTTTGSNNPAATIPDQGVLYDTITLTEAMCVEELLVGIDISHPWLADLTVSLICPKGDQIILWDGLCPGEADANVVMDDNAALPICGSNPALDGPIQPQDPLSTFKGEDVAGDWILCITDNALGDEGQLNNWSIEASNPFNDKCLDRVYVDVKVFLQGAYLSIDGLMTFDLTAAFLLPLFEPYSSLGFIHAGPGGGESVLAAKLDPYGKLPEEQIVDWVILELRDKADSTKVIATRTAFVTRDGTVVDLDCNPSVCFLDVPLGAYFVSVRHRNHLGVMTLGCVTLGDDRATAVVLDFTTASLPVWGTNAMVEMEPGIYGLWAGNAYVDDNVKYQGTNNENDTIKNDILGQPGNLFNLLTYTYSDYNETDVNLNGVIQFQGANNDSDWVKNNILAHPGNLFNLLTFIINEQLP